MLKPLTILLLACIAVTSHAQNIYSALHLNENSEYRNGKPSLIIETKIFFTSSGIKINRNVKAFDNAGMLLTEDRFDEEAKLKDRLAWTNDTIRHLKLQRVFEKWTPIGYKKEAATYFYDDKGFLIKVVDKDETGQIITVSELSNDDKGNPVELRLSDGNGNSYGIEKAEYFYDKNFVVTTVFANDGRKASADTQKINFRKPKIVPDDKSTYNEQGDALSYTSKGLNGDITFYEQEHVYDALGNCIDEKIYKVTVKENGRKKRDLDRHFKKQITYPR